MSRTLRLILAELGKPDDQGVDFYAWLTAQSGHALLGLLLAGLAVMVGLPAIAAWVIVAINYALIKELPDFALQPGWRAARDGLRDWLFVAGGALAAVTLHAGSSLGFGLAVTSIVAGLAIGTYQRAERAINGGA